MNEKKVNKSIIYMIGGVVILILAIAGSAYAYYSASATGEIVGTAAGAGIELTVTKLSTSANGDLIPLDNDVTTLSTAAKGYGNSTNSFNASKSCVDKNGYTVCQVYKITISNNSTVPITINGGVSLHGTNTPNIECAKMSSSTSVTNNTSCKGTNTLANNYTLNAGSSNDYYVIVYIKNIDKEQTDVGVFNGEVTFISTSGAELKAKFTEDNLVKYITNLYKNASKTIVTNNGIEYNQAPEVGLMNDRLGGTTSDYDAGNIRYYGKSPNNYIDIGDTDSLGNAILYRIIGLFRGITLSDWTKKDLIKVIRNDSIGDYSWDTSADVNSNYGINEWSQADAMKLLNPGYENESVNNSLWWNSQSGTCYKGFSNKTTTCDFTNAGISDNAKSKIEEIVWNTGGYSSSKIYPNQSYFYERGDAVIQNPSDGITRNITWTGKIALMYPSDYGYSVDFSNCSETLFNYDNCNNYLRDGPYLEEWFLTPVSSDNVNAFNIEEFGSVSNYSSTNAVTPIAVFLGPEPTVSGTWMYMEIRPVFYLSSDVTIESGYGTESDPYVIS